MKELLLKLLKEAQANLKEGETLNETHLTELANSVEKSGKFIPEKKYLETKEELKNAKETILSNEQQIAKFKDVDVESLEATKAELSKLQQEQSDNKEAAVKAAADKKSIELNERATKAFASALTKAGAIDAGLVTQKAIAHAGGIDKIEFNEDGSLKTNIEFAINHVKTEHATNFKTESGHGGAEASGAGGNGAKSWTEETAKEFNKGKSDQEIVDKAKEDSEYAKAAGLTSYIPKEG